MTIKKQLWLLSVLLLSVTSTVQGQWTDNGSSITTNDNVGIGTTNPSATLDVRGTAKLLSASGFSSANYETWVQLTDRMQAKSYYGVAKRFEIEVTGGHHRDYGKVIYYIDGREGLKVVRHIVKGDVPWHQLKIYSDNSKSDQDIDKYIVGFKLGNGGSWWSIDIRARNLRDGRWMKLKEISEPGSGFTEVAPTIKDHFTIDASGNVGIGTINPTARLAVDGTIKSGEVIVAEDIGADFVFEEDYPLPSLETLEKHIRSQKHLPGIPSAGEMKREGVNVGGLQIQLLQKIEELTLHLITMDKQIKTLKQQNNALEKEIKLLKSQN